MYFWLYLQKNIVRLKIAETNRWNKRCIPAKGLLFHLNFKLYKKYSFSLIDVQNMTVVSTFFTYRDTDMHFLKEKYAGLLKTCGGPSVIKCNELNVFLFLLGHKFYNWTLKAFNIIHFSCNTENWSFTLLRALW